MHRSKRLLLVAVLMAALLLLTGCPPEVPVVTEKGTITGVVKYPAAALDHVAVVILDEEQSQVVGEDGSFSFTNVPVGLHEIRVDSALFGSEQKSVELPKTGVHVELGAYITQVTTMFDEEMGARVIITPDFPTGVKQIRIAFSTGVNGTYTELGVIALNDIFVKIITDVTDPGTRYYLRLTHEDANGIALRKLYNQFSYQPPVTLLTPVSGGTATATTLLKWSPAAGGTHYRVRITAADFSYSDVSSIITGTEMVLGSEFTLPNKQQTYNWEVTALTLDGTDATLTDVRSSSRSTVSTFNYTP